MKEMRLNKGLSQKQLADKSGVNVRMIQHYEQGTKNINHAKLETLVTLSAALGCCVSELLTDNNLIEKCKQTEL